MSIPVQFPATLLLVCFLVVGLPARPAGLRAAAVKVDITPQTSQWLVGYDARQSMGVHDRIFHRILAIDDGKTKFYLIASDLCLFSPSVYDEVVEQLEKQFGIPRRSAARTLESRMEPRLRQ